MYRLRAGFSTGRIDSERGPFEIRDSELECEDYDDACYLVRQYSVEWPDGDPGPDDDVVADAADSDDEAEAVDDEEVICGTLMADGSICERPADECPYH